MSPGKRGKDKYNDGVGEGAGWRGKPSYGSIRNTEDISN